MINRHGAFLLGYSVPLVGVHFNASEVLALAGRDATEALGQRIGLSAGFVQAFMNAVHDESIRRQTSVWEQLPLGAAQNSTKDQA